MKGLKCCSNTARIDRNWSDSWTMLLVIKLWFLSIALKWKREKNCFQMYLAGNWGFRKGGVDWCVSALWFAGFPKLCYKGFSEFPFIQTMQILGLLRSPGVSQCPKRTDVWAAFLSACILPVSSSGYSIRPQVPFTDSKQYAKQQRTPTANLKKIKNRHFFFKEIPTDLALSACGVGNI